MCSNDSFNELVASAQGGDWCSAGIIHYIQQHHLEALVELNIAQAEAAIRYGQALAAINCQFEGARGAMYKYKNRSGIMDQIEAIQIA